MLKRILSTTALATTAMVALTVGMSHAAKAQPVKAVAPGTLVVHFNGYLSFGFAEMGSTYNKVTTPTGTYKLSPTTSVGSVRIYPGFDATTLGGLEYGAQLEARNDLYDAGVGPTKTTGSGGAQGLGSFYIKRAYGYLGTPGAGFVKFGQGDGAFELYQAGVIEAFGDGSQWNADGGLNQSIVSAASPGLFIYADTGNLYATDKISYLSPAFYGFSIAGGYEPNSNAIGEGYGNNTIASSTSAALAASPVPGDIGKRRQNTFDVAVQYALAAGGVKYKASAGYITGSPVQYDGPPVTGLAVTHGYDNLDVYQLGAQATFAGLTVGANIKGGQLEDGYAFKPKGSRNAFGYIIGANYVIGKYVVGASYFNEQSAGAYYPGVPVQYTGGHAVARTLSEYGIAVGGNYVLSPNLAFYLQYLYGHKHQPGVAFGGTTTVGTVKTANGSVGNAQSQGVGVGATLKW